MKFFLIKHALLLISVFVFVVNSWQLKAQTPGKCLEIESILVDACVPGGGCTNSGSPACNCEGKNEMVRFKIGPLPINTSDLDITWPNNTYRGISAADPVTGSHVAILNATIQSCGFLKEPTGGVLPAGATVLLITSTDMCNTANSFANLSDTIYVIFQNAGNYAGHFVNYNSSPGLRTTIFKQISTNCADTVTYDRSLLVNQSNGYGGSSAQNDGSTVEFSWPGVPTYVNRGCMAPFNTIHSVAGNGGAICPNGVANLSGNVSGNYTSFFWQGGLGTIAHPDSLNTTYTAAPSETDSVVINLGVVGNCNDTVYGSTTIHIGPLSNAAISTPNGDTAICSGNSLVLTASGGSSYLWNTGSTNNTINVTAAGTYTVTATTMCDVSQAVQNIVVLPAPTVHIDNSVITVCAGGFLELVATGSGNFLWSTGATTDSISVSSGGSYSITASNSCGSSSDAITISTVSLPSAQINPNTNLTACAGNPIQLTATGGSSYLWNTGAIGNSITVNTGGQYIVAAFNSCGADSASVTVTTATPASPVIAEANSTICAGDSLLLNASGGNGYLWSTGETTTSIVVNSSGIYTVSSTNACGVGVDSVIILTDTVLSQFTADSLDGITPHTVDFTNQSSINASYWWTFGDSTSSTETSPSHVYQNPGIYNVMLITTSNAGCKDTAYIVLVFAEQPVELNIPNVFTPNGDNTNDEFFVKGISIKQFKCEIYDRWGLKVTELNSINEHWDGRTKAGRQVSTGTYYYIITATDIDNKEYLKNGYIQLIR